MDTLQGRGKPHNHSLQPTWRAARFANDGSGPVILIRKLSSERGRLSSKPLATKRQKGESHA
jgi:hypothetical protein